MKIGSFKPEYVGKCQFYCAALDEQVRLPHEKPTIGLVLCKSADRVQVRLALTAAANRIGVATYQTALPDPKLIRQRLKQLPGVPRNERAVRRRSGQDVPRQGTLHDKKHDRRTNA